MTTGENFVNMRSTPLQVYTNNVSCKTECANIAEDFVGLAVSQNRTFVRKNRIQTSKEKVMTQHFFLNQISFL